MQGILSRLVGKAANAAPWIFGAIALVVLVFFVRSRLRRRSPGLEEHPEGGLRHALGKMRHDFFSAYKLVGQRGKGRFLAAIGLTTGLWLARCSVATAVLYGLGQQVDPILYFLLQWVVFMMMVFVPTPGAALGAEASFSAVMDGFVSEGILGVVTAGWRFFSFYLPLLLALAVMPLLGTLANRDRAQS